MVVHFPRSSSSRIVISVLSTRRKASICSESSRLPVSIALPIDAISDSSFDKLVEYFGPMLPRRVNWPWSDFSRPEAVSASVGGSVWVGPSCALISSSWHSFSRSRLRRRYTRDTIDSQLRSLISVRITYNSRCRRSKRAASSATRRRGER